MALVKLLSEKWVNVMQIVGRHQFRTVHILRNEAFINGKWVGAASGKTFSVNDPFDNKVLGVVPDMDVGDVEIACCSASRAFENWRHTTAKERSEYLRRWYDLLVEHEAELASIVTAESGKPIKEAIGEVQYGNSFIAWFSEEARRINGDVLCSPTRTKEMILIKQPIGVAGLITPWNFPIAMITRKAGAALAAGCTCIIKPAEDTPLTALAVAALAEEAGIPEGVINVVTCARSNASSVGQYLCESPLVAGISFTGSTEVGKILYKQCSQGVKRLSLELGGNAPFVVFNSADLDKAVEGAIASKFRNCGQTCVSANRFLVQQEVFPEFVAKLSERMSKDLILGPGSNPVNTIGPLINGAQLRKVSDIVDDALHKGAEAKLGGKPAKEVGANFYQPTLLMNISKDMRCYKQEIFGPVVVCYSFNSEEEAVEIANDTSSGLAAYFYSNDIKQIWRVAKQLSYGMIGINEGIISSAEAAFGGVKESGIGREGSHYGIDEYIYVKYLCFGNL